MTRHLLQWCGHGFVALGVVGLFVPLLPTTSFLLLASACYVRSSEKHYQRLLNSPVLGSLLRDYYQKRGVTVRTKVTALTVLWVALGYSACRVPVPAAQVLLLCAGLTATFVLLRLRTVRE
ncbi:MAG: YbaN family protein [Chloroherpetonaceae bacterium]|nr:YbaN family protein [Chthonomonadaceae bacterium]MDW8208078.1 YbaN family protein [Chloroherpetonaceae bacterium]